MFIYHFSRLIKSKLIWGLLALLMVFAFVVADSCRSASPNANVAGFLDGNAVTYQESESAAKTLAILSDFIDLRGGPDEPVNTNGDLGSRLFRIFGVTR